MEKLKLIKYDSLLRFFPFWAFLLFYKFGSNIHFFSMSPLGERVMPIWVVGLAIGATSLIQLIFDVPAGLILDKFGYKKFLKITTLIFIFATSILLLGLNRYTYIFTLILSCFGWLFYNPGVNAYVLSHAPKNKAGQFISLRDTFDSVGVVLGSIFFAMLINLPVQIIAIAAMVVLTIAYVLISLSPTDTCLANSEKKLPTQNYYIKRQFINKVIKIILKLNPASLMLLLLALSSSIFYAIIWFVVPLVVAHSSSAGVMSWGLGIFDLSIVAVGFVIGKLVDKTNKKLLVFIGLFVFAIMGLFLGFNFGVLFLLIGFLATVGDEIASLSLWSWLYSLDKDHAEDGLVSGVVCLFQDLGWAIGPIIGGFLYFNLGPSYTIVIGSVFILITWIIYVCKVGKSHTELVSSLGIIPKKPHKSRNKH